MVPADSGRISRVPPYSGTALSRSRLSLTGLSPLPPGRPRAFQRSPVRPSTRRYPHFSLPRGRSLGFASAAGDCIGMFCLAFAPAPALLRLSLAADGNSWDHYAKGTPSPHYGGSDRLRAHDFRVCFTPLLEVLFTFPSRYWFAVGLPVVFSLAGWSPRVRAGFLVSRLTQVSAPPLSGFRVRASHPLRGSSPAASASLPASVFRGPYNPGTRLPTPPVWAGALSLAATRAIAFAFFSSGY